MRKEGDWYIMDKNVRSSRMISPIPLGYLVFICAFTRQMRKELNYVNYERK